MQAIKPLFVAGVAIMVFLLMVAGGFMEITNVGNQGNTTVSWQGSSYEISGNESDGYYLASSITGVVTLDSPIGYATYNQLDGATITITGGAHFVIDCANATFTVNWSAVPNENNNYVILLNSENATNTFPEWVD